MVVSENAAAKREFHEGEAVIDAGRGVQALDPMGQVVRQVSHPTTDEGYRRFVRTAPAPAIENVTQQREWIFEGIGVNV
jgi:hypothetical protein